MGTQVSGYEQYYNIHNPDALLLKASPALWQISGVL